MNNKNSETQKPTSLAPVILVVIVVALIAFVYFSGQVGTGKGEGQGGAAYFEQEMISRGIASVGQPIEGFDAEILMRAFPGLVAADFKDVETFEGHYQVDGDTISFARNASSPVSSAERAISDRGFETLLANVSARLNMPKKSEVEVEAIIAALGGGRHVGFETLTVAFDEQREYGGLMLTVKEVIEDSRCPSDVVCIQAGTVRVRAEIKTAESAAPKEQTLVLGEEAEAYGIKVKLSRVEPAPVSTVKIKQEDYRFTFEVAKVGQRNSRDNS